jgi:predicted nucleotide-binding protein
MEKTEVHVMPVPDPTRVFIVYGRNRQAHGALKLFLRALKLNPLDFDEVRNDLGGAPFVGEVVREGLQRAQGVIVLFTPDEYAALRPELRGEHDTEADRARWQPRMNVIFEAGMALALNETRTILVVLGKVPLPSDLHGRLFFRLDNSAPARTRLRDALVGIGCAVDRYTGDLYDLTQAGDFEGCLQPPALREVTPLSPFRGVPS